MSRTRTKCFKRFLTPMGRESMFQTGISIYFLNLHICVPAIANSKNISCHTLRKYETWMKFKKLETLKLENTEWNLRTSIVETIEWHPRFSVLAQSSALEAEPPSLKKSEFRLNSLD